MVDSENKYKQWMFTIQAVKGQTLPGEQTVLRAVKLLTEKYLFQLEKATSLHYQGCCITKIRKRQQTLVNDFAAELEIPKEMITISAMQGTWEQAKDYCSKRETSFGDVFTNELFYTRSDITILDEPKNRFPWQAEIIDKIFEKNETTVKDPDDRTIVWISCEEGNTGKSKLVKWCCVNHDTCVKVSFGSSGQLRSAIISAGPRLVYFVDVPRTLGSDDSIHSLMSALEDLKGGFVVSAFYGKSQQLIIDPPHIVVFSNKDCPTQMMSKDRWDCYFINYKKELIPR